LLPKLDAAGVNVKVIAAVGEELFHRQPAAYRHSVLRPEAAEDLMFVTTGTRRVWPLRTTGRLVDEYSLTADQENVSIGSEGPADCRPILSTTHRAPRGGRRRPLQQRVALSAALSGSAGSKAHGEPPS
jgi:hypothetical protein